jgi:hypothetical protein
VNSRQASILSVIAGLLLSAAAAADSEVHRRSLSGAPRFFVRVKVDQDFVSMLSMDAIRAEVEAKLRSAGIQFSLREESSTAGLLEVTVAGGKIANTRGAEIYYAAVVLNFLQKASLVREPSVVIPAITWQLGRTGAGPQREAAEKIREHVRDLSDKFAQAYLSVNPK